MKSPSSPVKMSGSVRFAAPLLDAGSVELLGLFEPVAFGIDLDDLGAVEESVDERDDAGGVGEDLAPLLEGLVGAQDRRAGCWRALRSVEI